MTHHTASPWHLFTHPDTGLWIVNHDQSRPIAEICVMDGRGRTGQAGRDTEGMANARLLLAAPALLRALRHARQRLLDVGEPLQGPIEAALHQAKGTP